MSALMRELVRTTLARSLYVAAAFVATLIVYIVAGQAPERSVWEWLLLVSVLTLLALFAGLMATSIEMQER